MEPAPLTSALEAIAPLEAQARALEHPWQLRLERARDEAEQAKRRSQAVAPDHRWVARSLERDWNEKLTALDQLERDYTALVPVAAHHVSAAERQRIVAFAYDLPLVWQADSTPQAERKQVVRFLMKDVTLTKLARPIRLDVRWQTHACSPLEVARPQRAWVIRRTHPEVVERVRQWAPHHTALDSAERLTHAGYRRGQGGAVSASQGEWLR